MAHDGNDDSNVTNKQEEDEDHEDEQEEDFIFVLYVSRDQAKKIKTLLESHEILHKGYRMMTTTSTSTADTVSTSAVAGGSAATAASCNYPNSIAVPILIGQEDNNESQNVINWLLSIPGVLGTGYQKCLPSSRRLGGGNHHHHPKYNNKKCSAAANKISNEQLSSLVEQCLYDAAKAMIIKYQQQHQQQEPSLSLSSLEESWRVLLVKSIRQLPLFACPLRLETLGDDKTLVIPQRAFAFNNSNNNNHDKKHDVVIFETCFQEQVTSRCCREDAADASATAPTTTTNIKTSSCQGEFLQELWKQLAMKHNSPRIVRKGGVDPNSRIRESGYQILWPPPPTTTASTAITTGPNSPGWITVTEQGIRQSFDLTRVMFSRGNITEKIRFGKTLVQAGDVVLDLYAGIGYFTLPALIHGHAALVVACEWNEYAIQALKFNLQDNGLDDDSSHHRVIVLQGDCRQLAQEHDLVDKFDRVSLGLLPSSEGGWRTAVYALRRSTGGWLHIHGNVPISEVNHWALWLCHQLATFVIDMLHCETKSTSTAHTPVMSEIAAAAKTTTTTAPETIMSTNWVVICTHIEKVKSFAPTVNHYVADVFVGPMNRLAAAVAATTICSNHNVTAATAAAEDETLLSSFSRSGSSSCEDPSRTSTDVLVVTAGVLHPDGSIDKVLGVPSPPSCALSPDGVLCQAWMMPARET